jgi:LacI family transcriptional regulator
MPARPHILILIESSRESGRAYIKGIADYAHHFGPWRFHYAAKDLDGLQAPLEELRFDGIIARDVASVKPLTRYRAPMVSMRYSTEGTKDAVFVVTDDRMISRTVADHLLQRGFRHFAFCGILGRDWSVKREDHFRHTLGKTGFSAATFNFASSRDGEGIDDADEEAVMRWLRELPKPAGIMAANDDIGLRVVQHCREAGVRVPEECAVVGVDNDPVVSGLCDPPLSSVAMNFQQAGYRIAEVLDRMMRGEPPGCLRITSLVDTLVIRQSSDVVAVEDAAVARALRYLQRNSLRQLRVDEVARVSGVSRRSLENRFRQHLAKSVKSACREMRADHIARILTQSAMSVDEIAQHCGFQETSHLTRFFKAVRGETPSAFRKRLR